MEKKTVKKLIGILLIFSILIVTLLCADMYKVLCNDEPLFSVKKAVYEDGGTVEYIGLGYKIFKIRKIEYSIDKIKLGTIFSSYETVVGDEVND